MSRPWLGLSIAGAFVLLAALAAVRAEAGPTAFPGRNGTILAGGGVKGKLYALSLDGRRKTEIRGLRTAQGGGQAAWSPDGTKIAFASREGGIVVADGAGRHRFRLTNRGQEPAWSPDGSQLVFTLRGWLHVVRTDGRDLRRLFPGWDAQWSPDGSRLAFQLRDAGSETDSLYVSALDGSERRRLKAGSSYDCLGLPGSSHFVHSAWAPDGSRVAYVWWQACGANAYASIYAVSLDGSQGWDLVEGYQEGGPFAPVWSPDGSALAYFEEYDYPGARNGLKVLRFGGTPRTIASTWVPFDWRPVCGLRGGPRADRLEGSDRDDLVCGLRGNDTITGGAGRDRLFGEDGNDRFFARDGEFDVVGCGSGRDTVVSDRGDLVGRDCERVDRR
jgi:dipeptidyl aminopeptidase/acylaminoacyl peptidase